MKTDPSIITMNERLSVLLQQQPELQDFFSSYNLPEPDEGVTVERYFAVLSPDILRERGTNITLLREHFYNFFNQLSTFTVETHAIHSLDLIGGHDKHGNPENLRVHLKLGDILSIVGPTGAGKSRLLEDIECLAQGDTPTGRKILINGLEPEEDTRLGVDNHLVAQLSQNMNFVVDLCVADFLAMHAESRMVENPHQMVELIFDTANRLAGERFHMNTPVTALSGGQSRALMIADTACLSSSPIVLIDEIENAGVDRHQALELLIRQEKIVLLVTHDPALALMAPRRLVIRDGGMKELLERTPDEERLLADLQQQLDKWSELRRKMRNGERL